MAKKKVEAVKLPARVRAKIARAVKHLDKLIELSIEVETDLGLLETVDPGDGWTFSMALIQTPRVSASRVEALAMAYLKFKEASRK